MAKDTLVMDKLPRVVDLNLRVEFNNSYTEWRRGNPDGEIIDWMLELPDEMYWATGDTNSARWLAWVYLLNWLTNETRLAAVKAAQRKGTARREKYHAKLERLASSRAVS